MKTFNFLEDRVNELQQQGFGFKVANQIALLENALDKTNEKLETD